MHFIDCVLLSNFVCGELTIRLLWTHISALFMHVHVEADRISFSFSFSALKNAFLFFGRNMAVKITENS